MKLITAAFAAALPLVMTLSAQSPKPAPAPPELEFAFEVRATIAAPLVLGQVPTGLRRIIDVTGGTFEGPNIKGKIRPGGADWQVIRADGFTEVDARYTLETDQGETIYVSNIGIRHAPPEVMADLNAGKTVDPKLVYFRTVPKMETAAPRLQWLTRSIFVCTADRYPDAVVIRYFRVK